MLAVGRTLNAGNLILGPLHGFDALPGTLNGLKLRGELLTISLPLPRYRMIGA